MEEMLSSVAMDGDHHIDVIEEAIQRVAVVGDKLGRGNVGWVFVFLDDAVVGGSGRRGSFAGDWIGGLFERATVIGHEAKARPEDQFFGDVGSLEQVM